MGTNFSASIPSRNGPADRAQAIATVHTALDAGITLLDTGDFYGMGHNELLIAEALRGYPPVPVSSIPNHWAQGSLLSLSTGTTVPAAGIRGVRRWLLLGTRHASRAYPGHLTIPGRARSRPAGLSS